MKEIGKTVRTVAVSILIVLLTVTSYLLGYDYGYSAAMDKYINASECKPSRKWRQRF